MLQSVLTGNLAANALVRLAAFGIESMFDLDVGAFGSDHADRSTLVPVAVGRAGALRGRRFTTGQVWVVGDSPKDLECARAGGVRCLLVATGRVSAAALLLLEPDALLPDLSDVDATLSVLHS